MLNNLVDFDVNLFLYLNGLNNHFFDMFFSLFTTKEMWLPFYIVLIVLIFKKYRCKGFLVIGGILLAILAADQLCNIVKTSVERLRPSRDPAICDFINNAYVWGGVKYGFFSAHAANTFALVTIIGMLAKRKYLWIALSIWAVLTAYSRIYVGVHYPLDLLCGAAVGVLIGWGAYSLIKVLWPRLFKGGANIKPMTNSEMSVIIFSLSLFIVAMLMVSLVTANGSVSICR